MSVICQARNGATVLGLSQIFGRFTPHRPEEPVLGKPKTQHRLFTAVREIPPLLSS